MNRPRSLQAWGGGHGDQKSAQEDGGISLRSVSKRFGETAALAGLDVDIAEGELLVLLGPSGSGKSTTLALIAGLEDSDSGSIYFGGRDVTRVPPEDRDVSVVFQNYSLYPHMSVRANITFPLRLKKAPKAVIEERLHDVTTMLGIDQLLKRKITELSGGQRQRVAIAKALMKRPTAFLLDEPFSALDAVVRRQLRSELLQLHLRLGTTMVFVTHDQDEAMTIADRIALMRDGRIEQIGAPLDIYNDPMSLWVAEFIGGHPINVIPAGLDGSAVRLFDSDGDALACPPGVVVDVKKATASTRSAIAGIRPELVELWPQGSTTDGQPAGTVETRQIHGTEIVYDVRLGSRSVRAVIPSLPSTHVYELGDSVGVNVMWAGAFLFDPETGARLPAKLRNRPGELGSAREL
jgi:multiple sugar transport system ATP-binding protein